MPAMPVFKLIYCPICGNHISLGIMIANTPLIINIMGNAYIRCEKCNSRFIYNYKKGAIKFKK